MKTVHGIPERSLTLSYKSITYNFVEQRYKTKVSEIKIKRS